ncbi:hypothetical protein D6V26_19895 [Vibrio cholerae]|nr:hypothetical protein [Vibrio cholerae]
MKDLSKLTDKEKNELFSHMIVNPDIWTKLAQQPKKFDKVVENFNSILQGSTKKAKKVNLDKYDENDLVDLFFEIGKTQKNFSQALSESIIDLRKVDSLIYLNSKSAEHQSRSELYKYVKEATEIKNLIGNSKCNYIDENTLDLYITKEYAQFQYDTNIENDISFVGHIEEIDNQDFKSILNKAGFEDSNDAIYDLEKHLKHHNDFINAVL